MINKIFATDNRTAATILRITLGCVIFPHGAQKLLGWFGGHGFSGTIHFFTETMGIPYLFALFAILFESVGALALIAGLCTRFMALGIGATIGTAAVMVSAKNGFFMNWFGNKAGEGFEYHLLVVGIAIALVISGGGRWSVDRIFAGNTSGQKL